LSTKGWKGAMQAHYSLEIIAKSNDQDAFLIAIVHVLSRSCDRPLGTNPPNTRLLGIGSMNLPKQAGDYFG
jgi:hypothetical protein